MATSTQRLGTHIQFARFTAVGIGNSVVDAAVFTLIVILLDWNSGAPAVLASSIGFLSGAIHSYAWNSRFTFGRTYERGSMGAMTRFLATVSIGAAIAAIVFALVAAGWSHQESRLVVAKVVATAAAMGWNFSIMRYWVFRH